jgi:hypothetical protein
MRSMAKGNMSINEWGMLIGLSILWGGSFFFTEIAVAELPPFTIVAVRVGLAAIILNIVLGAMGVPLPRDKRIWVAFFGMGLLNNAIPVLVDRLGPDPHRQRPRLRAERHNARSGRSSSRTSPHPTKS